MQWCLLILAVAVIGGLRAQSPAILQNGVFNNAGRMPGSLPGGSIAPGSRFTIRGVRLGTDVRTTIVTVRAGTRSAAARLLAVTSREIEAILPRTIVPGEATVTVSRGGESSLPFSFRVAPQAVGLYSANHLGWGPARIEQVSGAARRPLAPQASVAPGEVVALRATGIGTGSRPRLFVGGRPASILSAGPKVSQAGMDEIVFRVPRDVPEGCYVPVFAESAEGAVSNVVTLPVARGRASCTPPEGWLTSGLQSGVVLLSRFSMLLETRPGDLNAQDHESIEATFAAGTSAPLLVPLHLLPPSGTCTGWSGTYEPGSGVAALAGPAFDATGARGLDAGEEIEITGPAGKLNLVAGPEGFYRARISRRSTQPFLVPGEYRVSSRGGTAVGPFAAAIRVVQPLTWKNRERLAAVDRRQGVAVEWMDADPQRPVLIVAMSVDRLTTAAYACLCAAPPGATRFAIPAAMLANLPATRGESGLPNSFLLLMQSASGGYARFHTNGLPSGTVIFLAGTGRSITYR